MVIVQGNVNIVKLEQPSNVFSFISLIDAKIIALVKLEHPLKAEL